MKNLKTVIFLAIGLTIGGIANFATSGSAAESVIQEMRGVWNGFIQNEDEPVEMLRTEITEQQNRRFSGVVHSGGPHIIDGTVSASGRVNYQGRSSSSHIIGKAELQDFGGGGAILHGTQKMQANTGFIVPCVLELRAFAGDGSVVPVSSFIGTQQSDGTVEMITIAFSPSREENSPTSLSGELTIAVNGQMHSFDLLGTVNESGRIIAIGHKERAGHLTLDGALAFPEDPNQPVGFNGELDIVFGDGSVHLANFSTATNSVLID